MGSEAGDDGVQQAMKCHWEREYKLIYPLRTPRLTIIHYSAASQPNYHAGIIIRKLPPSGNNHFMI